LNHFVCEVKGKKVPSRVLCQGEVVSITCCRRTCRVTGKKQSLAHSQRAGCVSRVNQEGE
jgi:hypothetical protein